MKVKTGDSSLFSYPDLTVVCGEPVFHDQYGDALVNPRVIFEVLSPNHRGSTIAGRNFFRHRNFIDTLSDYVFVSRRRALVEHFSRRADGQGLYFALEGMAASLEINSIGLIVSLPEIYDRVTFTPVPESIPE